MKKILTSFLLGLVHFFVTAQSEFITTWKTDNPGVSADNQITIPTFTGETYNYTVNWGDGTSDSNVSGDITHTYGVPGTYQVSISGDFPRIYFNGNQAPNSSDVQKILSVNQWGNIEWSSFENAFGACSNLDVEATDSPNLSGVSSLKLMFDSCINLIGNSSFNNWNVSNITNLQGVFANAENFNQNIEDWNVSSVTTTSGMFFKARSFNQPIGSWNVQNVEDMSYMFSDTDSFNQSLNSWNTIAVNNMEGMFQYTLDFNQPLNFWNLSNVENMQYMFLGAKSFDQNINDWAVSSVSNMYGMFQETDKFNQPLNAWDVSNVTNMSSMFWNALAFNQNLEDWNVSNVQSMNSMFNRAYAFDQDLGDWNIANVASMYQMFFEAGISQENYDNTLLGWGSLPSLQTNVVLDAGSSTYCEAEGARQSIIDTYGWSITDGGKGCPFITTWKTDNSGISASNQIIIPTFTGEAYNYSVDWGDGTSDSNVTGDITHTYGSPGTYTVSIYGTFPRIYFNEGGDANKLINIKQWGNIAWTSMESAFAGCSNLSVGAEDVPDLSAVTSLRRMFLNCNYTFDFSGTREFSNFNGVENFNSWDVSTITDMSNMFDKSTFNQEISSWDVSNVEDMSYMFFSSSFNQDINSWDVGNVTNMMGLFSSGMFNHDVSNWDVGSVVNMDYIFNSTYFNHDITAWNVANLVSMRHAFSQGHFDQDLSSWDISNVLDMSNAFDDSDLSKENYDAILSGWSQLSGLQTGVVLGANDAVYCLAETERTTLINTYGWTINDYGIACEAEVPFVTTWKTDNPGPSNDNQITIPTSPTDIYDYRVDWGDGTINEGVTGDITHTYAQPGVYEVSITGKFPRIYFNGYEFAPQTSDDLKLLSVDQWGTNRWKSMDFSFAGCENMDVTATDIPDFSRGVSLTGMFWDAKSLVGNPSIANWDIEKATFLNFMFRGASNFNVPIGEWNLTGKRDIYGMFEDAESFDQDLSNWNVQDMDNMTNLFKGSGLSNRNYDKILIGWSQLPSLKNGVQLDAPENYYCSAAEQRQSLIDNYNWIINDAGANGECFFVTTWKTDNPGASASNQITIPTHPDEIYDYNINWGDGTSDVNVNGDITHTYSSPGTYTVSISGNFPRIYFNYFPEDEAKDYEKLISVDQWGNIQWSSMADAFARCTNLDIVATDVPDLSNVEDMGYMFRGCSNLVGNNNLSDWDTSNVTAMFGVFSEAPLFNQDIGGWNVSNVTDMGAMFWQASSFDQDISSWDVSKVTRMVNMFSGAMAFNQNIGGWNVSSVDDMAYMFRAANSFDQNIGGWNVSNVSRMEGMFMFNQTFNQDISPWDVSNVNLMGVMFWGAELFNQDISSWDVSSVTDMDSMFEGATSFNQDLGSWDISNVTTMSLMFWGVPLSTSNYDAILNGWSSLPSLNSNIEFHANLSKYCSASAARQSLIDDFGWEITDGGNTGSCFFVTTWKTDNPGISADNQITIPTFPGETYDYTVDWGDGTSDVNVTGNITHTYVTAGTYQVSISGDFPRIFFDDYDGTEQDSDKLLSVDQWGSGKWTSMNNAFTHCSNMDVLATDFPDLSQVTTLGAMFRFCESLVGNDSFSNWEVENVTSFSNMFDGATKFNQPIGSWDVSNAVNMVYMFSNATEFNSDISSWDISNVQHIESMFIGASSFNQPIGSWNIQNVVSLATLFAGASAFDQDISVWDVSNVENMGAMFSGASSFNQDISVWNVGKVTNMNVMFFGAASFNQPIGVWDVSKVTDMSSMFFEATSFNQPLNDWNTSNVTVMGSMFAKATSFNQPLNDWDISKLESTSGMFLGATSFNQDLSNWDMGNKTSIGGMFNGATSFDQSLGDWDIGNVTNMDYLFYNVGLSLENYDKTLLGWSNLPTVQSNVILNAGDSQFCNSEEARQMLIDNYGWVITDGGKVPFCNEDNDADGVLDHMDLCLDTRLGAVVDEYGCEIIAFDAIQVYVLTPSCTGGSDGAINISMNVEGHLLDVSISGDSYSNEFFDVASVSGLQIGNLSEGMYTITVSIPEALFEQTYGVMVNDLSSVTGKRTSMDSKAGQAVYEVMGSTSYEVAINGATQKYSFENDGPQTIVLDNLKGQTEVSISGESDCQGTILDSFFIGDTFQVFPTITAASVNILSSNATLNIKVFGLDGRLVKNLRYNQNNQILDISSLRSGVYILQGEINGQLETVKIIKK